MYITNTLESKQLILNLILLGFKEDTTSINTIYYSGNIRVYLFACSTSVVNKTSNSLEDKESVYSSLIPYNKALLKINKILIND